MSRTKRERRKVRRRLKALADKRAAEGSESQEISGVLIASRMIRIAGRYGPDWAARLLTGQIGVGGEQRLAAMAAAELRIEMKSEQKEGLIMNEVTRKKLADLAKTAGDWSVRLEAARRVDDQAIWADLAKTAGDWRVRLEAARRVDDQAILADLAKTDGDSDVRLEAARRVDDQAIWDDLAKTDGDWSVRLEAARRVDDQAIWDDLAKTDGDSDVRLEAEKYINAIKMVNQVIDSEQAC